MTERITEAELRAAEAGWAQVERANRDRPGMAAAMEESSWACDHGARLLAEVRRLRGLVVALEGVRVDGSIAGQPCDAVYCCDCGITHERERCPVDALEAEIGAIRDETGR